MYIDENYNDYTNLVELHDNYIVLSKKTKISGSSGDPDFVPAVANYFYPSVTIPFTYSSEQSFQFINYDDYLNNSLEDRADFPLIFICGFIIIYTLIFIINNLTKIGKRGGVFGQF